MEIIYAVDVKMQTDGEQIERLLTMDISCRNILALSCYYLPPTTDQTYSIDEVSSSTSKVSESSFCVYVCALEQPWQFSLIATFTTPVTHVVWHLDGKHLLVCNQTGSCQIYQMNNGCINTMESIYQYETKDTILVAKSFYYREPTVVSLDSEESIFFNQSQSPVLPNAFHFGHFICVTSSGTIHTLPVSRSSSPSSYCLSQQESICASLCDIYPTEKGLNVLLSEQVSGALIQVFVVHCTSLTPRITYISGRGRGFRLPSCYGRLQALVYFQRNGLDSVLVHSTSPSGDFIDLYEYSIEQAEWISVTLLNSSTTRVTSISLSPSHLCVKENEFQGLFGRQILVASDDGSLVCFDKLNLKCREQIYPISQTNLFTNASEFFIRIQHTSSGSCCLGFTQGGMMLLLRTIQLHRMSSLSMYPILVHFLEQYIVQTPTPCDIWDVLCLIPYPDHELAAINKLVDRVVSHYESQSLEFKRLHFARFKECLYHLHRLALPHSVDPCEHLISLLIYHVLLIVRGYLRLFVYEPANRNFVDAAQEILQQPSFSQNIDVKRIKFLGDQATATGPFVIHPTDYQLVSFTELVNWISDILFYLIDYLRLQQMPTWLPCKRIFHDVRQLRWIRELILYFHILHKMNKIPLSKIAHLDSPPSTSSTSQTTTNPRHQGDLLKDIYHSVTKFSEKIQAQPHNIFNESFLGGLSVLSLEQIESKVDSLFPVPYAFLRPNSARPQTFIRGQAPAYIDRLYGSAPTIQPFIDDPFFVPKSSTPLLSNEHLHDWKLDITSLRKMSLQSTPTFRRCLRCGNFSRAFTSKPYPLLASQLKDLCLCGGLFLQYS